MQECHTAAVISLFKKKSDIIICKSLMNDNLSEGNFSPLRISSNKWEGCQCDMLLGTSSHIHNGAEAHSRLT